MCFCFLLCHPYNHCHILSCSFGIYFCFLCRDLYGKHKRSTFFFFSPKSNQWTWMCWIFCAQPDTPKRITFLQGESSASSVMGHDEGTSSIISHNISLTSENVRWRSLGRYSCTVVLNDHRVNLTVHVLAYCRPWASNLQPYPLNQPSNIVINLPFFSPN